LLVTIAFYEKNWFNPRTSLNRYSGITSGFEAFFYAIVTENVAEIESSGRSWQILVLGREMR
jgi:hypothetical protein